MWNGSSTKDTSWGQISGKIGSERLKQFTVYTPRQVYMEFHTNDDSKTGFGWTIEYSIIPRDYSLIQKLQGIGKTTRTAVTHLCFLHSSIIFVGGVVDGTLFGGYIASLIFQ